MVKLTELEQEFFAHLTRWKADYQTADFGTEEISCENRGQLKTVRSILSIVMFERSFFPWVEEKLKGLRPALGKRAGVAGEEGGRALGLIKHWAEQFVSEAPARARQEKEKREAFDRAATKSREDQKRRDQQAIDQAVKTLEDSTAPADLRNQAREILDGYGITTAAAAAKGAVS